jgi:hypothetical protein
MSSPILVLTAIESGFGFLLSSIILVLVLIHGRKTYHYLFAAFLFICMFWDLGTFLIAIRNEHIEELVIYGYVIGFPCSFISALIFHFVNLYTGRPVRWLIVTVWVVTGVIVLLSLAGLYWKIEGVYTYGWGNIFRVAPSMLDPLMIASWFGINLYACWLLYKAAKRAETPLERRHFQYVTAGLLVITVAIVKVGVVMGIDIPLLLPLGMFLVDIFNAIIGVAIIKVRLFDITLIVKRGTLFSILAGLLIFIYSFTEHILITYVGERFGEESSSLHLISVAVGIAILMPLKSRLEHGIEGYFANNKLVF